MQQPVLSQREAHLLVAAVRVLSHQLNRPPSVDEIAALLGCSREVCGHQVRGLEARGILHSITGPFDARVEVHEHQKIEELPTEATGPGFKNEVEEFHRQFEKRQAELQNLFDSDDASKQQKQRLAGLDDELRRFKGPRRSPFGDSGEPS